MQEILDQLAVQVGLPVVLEDSDYRLVGYSSHNEPVDSVREQSILGRRAGDEVTRWLRDLGLADAVEPLRVPANDALQMLGRLCVPIRVRSQLLGFLWFVDPHETFDDRLLDIAVRSSNQLVSHLQEERAANRSRIGRLDDAARRLLSWDADPDQAMQVLVDEGFNPHAAYRVLVLRRTQGTLRGKNGSLFHQLLRSVHQTVGIRNSHPLVIDDHGVILYARGENAERRSKSVKQRLTSLLAMQAGRDAFVIGMSGLSDDLAGASTAYQQALQTARSALAFPQLGAIVDWSNLGIYRLISEVASAHDSGAYLHPRLAELFADPEVRPLLDTVEVYLDSGGHAQIAAAQLSLHRTSLYYRIQRFEQLTLTDLKDGLQRTTVHLALKVNRMTARD